ncbi:hypothetical protein PWT90_03814 [Aphanocladium album]|nr:hypothetical protein PWT90_03814 [Aphanocladium album]
MVTAMSVMQLVERGSLSLDDSTQLETLCPELKEVGVDWAGIAVERLTRVSLNDYMQTHIFQPLGLENISMIPTPEMKTKLAHMNYRDPSGKVIPRDHLFRQPLVVETPEEKAKLFNSACSPSRRITCPLWLTALVHVGVLAALLNDGTCPTTGIRLLSASSVADMFTTEGNTPQGFGLSCMLTGGATGRSEGTGWWAGLANQFWWVDREHGVEGLVGAQILPFGDPKVEVAWFGVEAAVYAALKEARESGQGTS